MAPLGEKQKAIQTKCNNFYTLENTLLRKVWSFIVRVFHKHTKLPMLALLPTLYLLFPPLFDYYDVSKCEIRFERVAENNDVGNVLWGVCEKL